MQKATCPPSCPRSKAKPISPRPRRAEAACWPVRHRLWTGFRVGVGFLLLAGLALLVTIGDRQPVQAAQPAQQTPPIQALETLIAAIRSTTTPTSTLTPSATLTASAATILPEATGTPTVAVPSVPITATPLPAITASQAATPENGGEAAERASDAGTPTLAPTALVEGPATPPPSLPVVELSDSEILTGTIVTNRTAVSATFFLEGQLYVLRPRRATGTSLRRSPGVLNLYNCQADQPDETGERCFWDPYPLRENGFYEIVDGAEEGEPVTLLLKEAVPPPEDQIWIQNRTGHVEQMVFLDDLLQIRNSSVQELTLDKIEEPVIHLRHCLSLAGDTVCEWLPHPVLGGVYYVLVEETMSGSRSASQITSLRLEPIVAEASLTPVTPTPTPAPLRIACRIQVPTLNVRSGPGLEYLVVAQVGQADESEGRIFVVGRNQAGDWLVVESNIAANGWVIQENRFLICDRDTGQLPIVPVLSAQLAPTPPPTPSEPPAAVDTGQDDAVGPEETPTPEDGAMPPDRAQLIVMNSFDHDIRFTLSPEAHDLPPGTAAEHDLRPGEELRLLIGPGRVQFSASSPFRNSSGNAEFELASGQTRTLFIRFVPSSEGSNTWELRFD
jgi:hypothetical protein